MIGTSVDRKLMTKQDDIVAKEIIASKVSEAKNGEIEVETETGEVATFKKMTDADIVMAMKSETVRAAFVMNMANMGISLAKLSEVANRGLDAYKVDKKGEVQPDFIAQLGWWRSIVEVYGIMQQAVNANTAVPGEQALDLTSMSEEELQKELKKQLGH